MKKNVLKTSTLIGVILFFGTSCKKESTKQISKEDSHSESLQMGKIPDLNSELLINPDGSIASSTDTSFIDWEFANHYINGTLQPFGVDSNYYNVNDSVITLIDCSKTEGKYNIYLFTSDANYRNFISTQSYATFLFSEEAKLDSLRGLLNETGSMVRKNKNDNNPNESTIDFFVPWQTFYEHELWNFYTVGATWSPAGWDKSMVNDGRNDRASSLVGNGVGALFCYEHINFNGKKMTSIGANIWVTFGKSWWNDKISSFR